MKKNFLLLLSLLFFSYHLRAQAVLNLRLFFNGYYLGNDSMPPMMFDCGVLGATPDQTDTIQVLLHDSLVPSTIVASAQCILMINGTATVIFGNSAIGHSFYITIKHRNTLETWSAKPVMMTSGTYYDFSTALSKAYGNNMMNMGGGVFAFYQGDINQDENIDLLDFALWDFAMHQGLSGYYPAADLNGDCNVDLLDFAILNPSINAAIYSMHP